MTLTRNLFFVILAVVLFAVGLVLIIDNGDAKTIQIMLFGGLASFAAAHI